MRGLNVGCGPDVRDGWTNVDPISYPGAVIGDAVTGLPFLDDSFDVAVANHVLLHVAWPDLVPFLAEVRRVLAPGGTFRILNPDLLGAVGALYAGEDDWFPIANEHEQSIDGKLCLYVSQAGATRSVFTVEWTIELLRRAGYERVRSCAYQATWSGFSQIVDLDSRPGESIIVEGIA